jgi:hypothetical protein
MILIIILSILIILVILLIAVYFYISANRSGNTNNTYVPPSTQNIPPSTQNVPPSTQNVPPSPQYVPPPPPPPSPPYIPPPPFAPVWTKSPQRPFVIGDSTRGPIRLCRAYDEGWQAGINYADFNVCSYSKNRWPGDSSLSENYELLEHSDKYKFTNLAPNKLMLDNKPVCRGNYIVPDWNDQSKHIAGLVRDGQCVAGKGSQWSFPAELFDYINID